MFDIPLSPLARCSYELLPVEHQSAYDTELQTMNKTCIFSLGRGKSITQHYKLRMLIVLSPVLKSRGQ